MMCVSSVFRPSESDLRSQTCQLGKRTNLPDWMVNLPIALKRIAVIEDNPDNRLLVRVIVEPHYEVTEYETGPAALKGMETVRPDLVLLDVSLPEMDGAEVLRRLRADPRFRPLPVVALTAHAMSGDREKFLAEGFDDYVAKPIIDENLLLEAIQRQLGPKPPSGP